MVSSTKVIVRLVMATMSGAGGGDKGFYCKAVGQADKMCYTVGWWWLQREHLESTLILHLLRFSGVGRVSDPALTRKESCPAGRRAWMRLHTLF